MIKENPLCQNLTIGKRGRPKNADKILKEKNKRQKLAEEEQSQAPRTSVRDEQALQVDNADIDADDCNKQDEAHQPRDPEQNPSAGPVDDKNDTFDLQNIIKLANQSSDTNADLISKMCSTENQLAME